MPPKYAPISLEKSDDSDLEREREGLSSPLDSREPTHLWKSARVVGIIVLYCLIGSSLSVMNKVAVTYIPAANFILLCQFVATSVLLKVAHWMGLVTVEPLTKEIAVAFLPLAISFFALLLAGMEVMQRAPLETFIAVKSLTPVAFSINEYLFLGRALPTPKSLLALVGIVFGAVMYVNLDIFSSRTAYAFCLLFIVAAVSEGLIAKHTIDKIKLNNWSRSFNINVLSIPLALGLFLASGESKALQETAITQVAGWVLTGSCVMGLGMSFSTMWIRETLSATSVSVVATCNKFLSELVNWVIWDKHTTVEGTYAILIIMTCGIFYEQAPLRVPGKGYARDTICPCLPRSWVGVKADEASSKEPLIQKS
ncbi:integral membrane family protein [Ostreococcus tauri]|uniref:Integral membrane family protein n=1 Tax=Ostreococcus tauri TaxID=70448 RepID=A0A1Y5I716_OSTTA|nr:integral membrane family protein [Ostreococcus tauri]